MRPGGRHRVGASLKRAHLPSPARDLCDPPHLDRGKAISSQPPGRPQRDLRPHITDGRGAVRADVSVQGARGLWGHPVLRAASGRAGDSLPRTRPTSSRGGEGSGLHLGWGGRGHPATPVRTPGRRGATRGAETAAARGGSCPGLQPSALNYISSRRLSNPRVPRGAGLRTPRPTVTSGPLVNLKNSRVGWGTGWWR